MGALVIFDQSNAKTFAAAERWKADIDKKCQLPSGQKIPTILIANKCDLSKDKRTPSDVEISQFVHNHGFVPKWYRTSAKTGESKKT